MIAVAALLPEMSAPHLHHGGLTEQAAQELGTSVVLVQSLQSRIAVLKQQVLEKRNNVAAMRRSLGSAKHQRQTREVEVAKLFAALKSMHVAIDTASEEERLLMEQRRDTFQRRQHQQGEVEWLGKEVHRSSEALLLAKRDCEVVEQMVERTREADRELQHGATALWKEDMERSQRLKRLSVAQDQCELTSQRVAGLLGTS